jgi:hypothetical protein
MIEHMSCPYTLDNWQAYVADRLPEALREQMEEHLYTCYDCLLKYEQAIDRESVDTLPLPELGSLLQSWPAHPLSARPHAGPAPAPVPSRKTGARSWNAARKAWFHYMVAASITLFLTASGAIQWIGENLFMPMTQARLPESGIHQTLDDTLNRWIDSSSTWMRSLLPPEPGAHSDNHQAR